MGLFLEAFLEWTQLFLSLQLLSFTYVPYYTDQDGNCLSNEGTATETLSRQPVSLHKRLKQVLQEMHLAYRYITRLFSYRTYRLLICISYTISYRTYTLHFVYFIGASLSEPHTSMTALQDACVCMSACGHIP